MMKKKIAILDDDNLITDDLKIFLEMEGYSVDLYNNAEDFMPILNSINRYDYILLDLMLRKPSNLEPIGNLETGEILFELIKKSNPSKAIIIITAKNESEVKVDTKATNVSFIRKPYESELENILKILEK